MSVKLVDVHAHLDLSLDIKKSIKEIKDSNMIVLSVTNHPKIFKMMTNLYNADNVRYALGYHPELLNEKSDINLFDKYFSNTTYIGEIGFDKKNDKNIQIQFLEHIILKANIDNKKILNIHARGIDKDFIDSLKMFNNGVIIFHWYTSNISLLKDLLLLDNVYFSFNFKMLNTAKGKELLNLVNKKNILTESDYPFTDYDNKKNYNKIYIEKSLKQIAEELNLDFLNVKELVYNNFYSMINKIV